MIRSVITLRILRGGLKVVESMEDAALTSAQIALAVDKEENPFTYINTLRLDPGR